MARTPTVSQPSIRRIPVKAGAEKIIDVLQEDGVVILENFCSPGVIEQLNHELEPYLAGDINLPKNLADFHGTRSKRVSNLPAKSRTFRQHFLNDSLVHDICRKIYPEQQGADYWLTMAAMLENSPGGDKQDLHRDQMLFPLCKALGEAGAMVMINFFVALGDITAENGGTRVIPGSHRWSDFTDHGGDDMAVPVEMKAGDAFLLGGKTVHAAGQNVSRNSVRRLMIFGFQPGYLTPFESFLGIPRHIIKGMTPLAQRMVGWGSPTVQGLTFWTMDNKDIGLCLDREGKDGLRHTLSDQ
ncbi:PhyH-domain-containing protein [Aspergillus floccosus]